MDRITPEARSKNMAAIRSKGNASTEIAVMSVLRKSGCNGWRRHQPVVGKPDFVWRREKVALFVDGCFWHGCPFCYKTPKSNIRFWKAKVGYNRERDRRVTRALRREGWRVIRIWECQVNRSHVRERINKVLKETK